MCPVSELVTRITSPFTLAATLISLTLNVCIHTVLLLSQRTRSRQLTATPVQVLSDAFTAIAAGTGTLAAIGTTYVLPAVGFCAAGVKAGSIAAVVQASVYGAAVPAGGVFATLKSWGATGALAGTLGAAALPVGIVVAGGTYLTGKMLGG